MSTPRQQSAGEKTPAQARPRRSTSPTRHQGRTAVVTGAAHGIGRAYAMRLAGEGARVVVADVQDGGDTQQQIEAAGGAATVVRCDVSDPESVGALARTVAELGGADILVHNAGIYPMGPADQITFEQWRHVLAVNLDSIFLLSQAFLPHMREHGWGRIVGVSSTMFHSGAPGSLHYVAAKGGIIGFIRALATEVGPDGVTVNAVAPGLIRTEGSSTGVHDALGLFDLVLQMQAIKRTGEPEDLTGAVSFLLSEEASWITGQTLVVDGGSVRA